MHADRANRSLLLVVGLIAVALGVGGLLSAAGVFGSRWSGRYLVDNAFSRYIGRHGDWVWPAIAAVAFIVTLLALYWLFRLLFSTDRADEIRLTPLVRPSGSKRGRTTMAPSALVQAVTDEIAGYHGVTAARGRILGDASRPTLALDLTASRRADLPQLIERIDAEAVRHARTAVGNPEMQVLVNLGVNDKSVSRAS